MKRINNPYSKSMQEAANVLAAQNSSREKLMGTVMIAAGVTTAATFATATAKAASLAKAALVKTICVAAAVTVSATALGTAVLVPPTIQDVSVQSNENMSTSDIVITPGLISPRSVVIIAADGTSANAAPDDAGQFRATVSQNGDYMVELAGSGGQTAIQAVTVDNIDMDIPILAGYSANGNSVTIRFFDDGSGIDWDSVYGIDAAGKKLAPQSINPQDSSVVFTLSTSIHVYVQDKAGNKAMAPVSMG